jgi:hypothetical protein
MELGRKYRDQLGKLSGADERLPANDDRLPTAHKFAARIASQNFPSRRYGRVIAASGPVQKIDGSHLALTMRGPDETETFRFLCER